MMTRNNKPFKKNRVH